MQGDQIGRIFAHWATVFFGHSKKLQNFWLLICINFAKKMCLGDILGDFFINSSGHPDPMPVLHTYVMQGQLYTFV
jgi:hypothetical protein